MPASFAVATLLMGIAGGPHCLAMCGAPCAYIQQQHAQKYHYYVFHLGRLIGYACLGAVAAYSVKSLSWLTDQTATLHPIWTFFHTLVFAWGLLLLIFAKQPTWADAFGRKVWAKLHQHVSAAKGNLIAGMLWALMPCGLLYSALLVASLQANPLSGAISMAAFALGTSVTLLIFPALWLKLKLNNKWFSDTLSMRLAGLLLAVVSAIAIWMDVVHQVKIWCN